MKVPLQNSLGLRQVIASLDRVTSRREVDLALRSADMDRRMISGPSVFLPLDISAKFVERLGRRIGERHLGALIGQRTDYTELSWYSEFVLSAGTLGEAFLRGANALPVMHPGSRVSLDRNDGRLVLLFHSEIQQVVGGQHINEYMPFLLIDLARRFLGPRWVPAWVELPNSSMKDKSCLEAMYGVPVRFRPDAAGIAMDQMELAAPNPIEHPARDAVLLRDLPSMLGVSPPKSFSETVVEVLRFQIVRGDISVETIAERLSYGVQTLQRRLRNESTSFRELRNEFLKTRAIDLLTQTDHSVEAIAGALGYTETNSFRRAFRTWTGLTPTNYVAASP